MGKLWTPGGERKPRKQVLLCTVPGCGTAFPIEQHSTWVRHTRDCAKRHEGEIDALVARGQNDPFFGGRNMLDLERRAYERRGEAKR